MAKLEIKYITKSVPLILDKKDKHRANDKNEFWELRGIDLSLNDGEGVGLIGDNGSGKSTLMKIIGQKEKQTTGFITTKNKITYASCSSLDGEKTGLENIRQQIANAEIDEFKGDHYTNGIINFSEIGELLYRPVKEYSMGMYARLSLSIALFVDPELVVLDEILTPLDRDFYFKAVNKIQQLKDTGVSFVIADIRPIIIETLCERAGLLQFGVLQDFGPTSEIARQYEYASEWFAGLSLPEKNEYLAEKQQEQTDFDVNKIYEVFKSEQFKNGYTRKDEPRMRKEFFVQRGNDPVQREKDEPKKEPKKKSASKTVLVSALVVIVLALAGGFFYQQNRSSSQATTSSQSSKSSSVSSSTSSTSQDNSQASSTSESSSSSSNSSERAASESSEQARRESESRASSESQASLDSERENTQTISVADGETLESLAAKYATTVEKIQELNDLGSGTNVVAGQTLYVPK